MTCNILVSTGAGISAESGIYTYRDKDGLWTKYNADEVSHINGWKKDPQKVINFKNMLRKQFSEANYKPNAAHYALTKLQQEWKWGEVTIVTQNIDGLHVDAGSKNVLEMHGTNKTKFCNKCGNQTPYDADIILTDSCIKCGSTHSIRPLVVLFGEMPMYLDIIDEKLNDCGIFAMIGSSGQVMPASLFAKNALYSTTETYLINKEELSYNADEYKYKFYGMASIEVPKWVDGLLSLKEEPTYNKSII